MTNNKRFNKIIRGFWILFLLPFIGLVVLFYLISEGKLGFMPTIEELSNPQTVIASEIISSDNVLMGKYFKENRTIVDYDDLSPFLVNALIATEDARYREHSGIDQRSLGRVIIRSIILNQDTGGGSTISQQLAKNLFPREDRDGLNLVQKAVKMVIIKFKEWVIAAKLERSYTKDEIIAMYFNKFDFMNLAVGVKSAARIYFNTSPDSLKIEQAATLVGMAKNPALFNPVRRLERTQERRNVVFSQMQKYGYITAVEADSLKQIPLVLDLQKVGHVQGISNYFREYLRITMNRKKPNRKNYYRFTDFQEDSIQWETNPLYGWCNKNIKPNGDPYNLYSDGLKIYTTIDSRMQAYAEWAMREHLSKDLQPSFLEEKKGSKKAPFDEDLSKEQIDEIMTTSMKRTERYRILRRKDIPFSGIVENFNKPVKMRVFTWEGEKDTTMSPMDSLKYYKFFLRGGFMSFDPKTGFVKAYVGGINYKYFRFDNVTLSKRQVGSTFKPFLYTLGMVHGYDPSYKIPNVPVSFQMPEGQDPPVYTPRFSTSESLKKYEGKRITLKFGLAHSLNQVSAWLMKQFDSPQAAIDIARKMGVRSWIDPVYSLCTGAAEVTLEEMVGAYSTFANKGVWVSPIFVTRIEDKNGNTIATFRPQKQYAISEDVANKMVDLLQAVANNGTASYRLRYKYGFTNEIACKTGTTNDNAVGWFIGVTPNLVSGGWMGGEERSIRFENGRLGQGANMALPIWALYMQKVYEDKSLGIEPQSFNLPEDLGYDPTQYEYFKPPAIIDSTGVEQELEFFPTEEEEKDEEEPDFF